MSHENSQLRGGRRALNEAGVPFIVVRGIAVVAHGYGRSTRDVDLVIPLQPDMIGKAFAALERLGYHPRVPITATQFGDPGQRAQWIRDKGMEVLNFHSDTYRRIESDSRKEEQL